MALFGQMAVEMPADETTATCDYHVHRKSENIAACSSGDLKGVKITHKFGVGQNRRGSF